jgi:hypothetical protein
VFQLAITQSLEFYDQHPAVAADAEAIHLVHRAEDEAIVAEIFDEAKMQKRVSIVPVPFAGVEKLEVDMVDARAVLVAASKAERVLPLMRRMAPHLKTLQRGAVGFPQPGSALEGGFVWLGESVQGVFAKFPPLSP